MNVEFQPAELQGLMCILQEVTDSEQTQELRLPEGMPDVGRVVGAWGQGILRSKQWHRDHISCSCGMQVWVLYEPEGQDQLQILNSWIPFQLCWDIVPDSREGDVRISLLTRFVDARSVSPRKIMVRAAIAGLADARVRKIWEIQEPVQQSRIPVLMKKHAVRLWKESGEKAFVLDEELGLPESVPPLQKLIYCKMDPGLPECRIVGDKLAFRGNGKLHAVYQSETSQVHSWDFEIPYSQYAQLQEIYGNDADCDMRFAVTSMETEPQDNGTLRLKCGVTGQYLVGDKQEFTVLEDAYHPGRELERKNVDLELADVTQREKLAIPLRMDLSEEGDLVPDAVFSPDFPLIQDDGREKYLCQPGTFHVLYYGTDGKLRSSVSRWEGKEALPDPEGRENKLLPHVMDMQAVSDNGGIRLKGELMLSGFAEEKRTIPMLTEVTAGKEIQSEESKPSVILLRCGKESLWDIAKRTGSTVENIAAANGLEGECEPGKLLLIPVG